MISHDAAAFVGRPVREWPFFFMNSYWNSTKESVFSRYDNGKRHWTYGAKYLKKQITVPCTFSKYPIVLNVLLFGPQIDRRWDYPDGSRLLNLLSPSLKHPLHRNYIFHRLKSKRKSRVVLIKNNCASSQLPCIHMHLKKKHTLLLKTGLCQGLPKKIFSPSFLTSQPTAAQCKKTTPSFMRGSAVHNQPFTLVMKFRATGDRKQKKNRMDREAMTS